MDTGCSRPARARKHLATTLLAALAWFAAGATLAAPAARVLDDFRDPALWKALSSDQVSASLRTVEQDGRRGLCLVYDFNGVSGHAAMRRELPLAFPADYAFDFDVRGSGPPNQFEFKLIDASGDNVWWVKRNARVFSPEWQAVRYRKREITPAWGPLEDKTLRATQSIEFTIYAETGGRGEACIADLRLGEREPQPASWPRPTLAASAGRVPASLFDASDARDEDVPWVARRDAARGIWLRADFGREREFGGLVLDWLPGRHASRYAIDASADAREWRTLREVASSDGGRDFVRLPEAEARHLRLRLLDGPGADYALARVALQPLAFGATQNAFVAEVARAAPRGRFPRAFAGEQAYWTVVGVDGGRDSALLGEDGAFEVARGGFSIEPFVREDDCADAARAAAPLRGWADVAISQHLPDGYLPMPGVRWEHAPARGACGGAWRLEIDAFAQGDSGRARAFASWRLENRGTAARELTLALALQPFQVNPPTQFLTTPGGVSEIHALALGEAAVRVDGRERVVALASPDAAFATPFDAGMAAAHLAAGSTPSAREVTDATGLASGALLYRMRLAPGEAKSVTLVVPLEGPLALPRLAPDAFATLVEAQRREVADAWRGKLDRLRLRVPAEAQPIADTLRTALAHILVERDGVEIRPGTRSYARSWIRDGAMMGEALLRLGHAAPARAFLEWYAPYQFDNGKVPCCVDARGSDPVPENDSHGELAFLAAEVARYTRDDALGAAMWPRVDRATRYMDTLRASERVAANRDAGTWGLLPPSISHEGYSAKPAYSYWDDFWGLIGYASAATLAARLGHDEDARRLLGERDAFRADILASITTSTRRFGIDYIPGAADLGDFDATSTTIALSPGGERAHLPQHLLDATFERYWREFVERRDGRREWKDYTPYEWRNVSAFVRLGWRARAHEAIAYFFGDRRPAAWNQWAEVVGRGYREPRFIGDLPHGWVASDFIRAVLDLFAYERADDGAIVLAAGVPAAWLDGEGVAIDGLHTPHGVLGYDLRRAGDEIVLSLRGDPARRPPGGYVLALDETLQPARTRIDGRPASWRGHELAIGAARAEVRIELARSGR